MSIQLPLKQNICFPENLDSSPHVYYSKYLGFFYRMKLKNLFNYLPKQSSGQVLEIGFGSGIALKELASRFNNVYAVDIHDNITDVEQMLKKEKISNVYLSKHDIFKEPFCKQADFDYVISSSVFEHIPSHLLSKGIENIYKDLKEGGYLLLGFPLKTTATRLLFNLYEVTYKKIKKNVYDFSSKEDHLSGEKEIVSGIRNYFTIEESKYIFNNFLKVYLILKCKKRARNENKSI